MQKDFLLPDHQLPHNLTPVTGFSSGKQRNKSEFVSKENKEIRANSYVRKTKK